jgi:hypothetical protein
MADETASRVKLRSIAYACRLLTADFVPCLEERGLFAADAIFLILKGDSRLIFSPNPASRKACSTRAL